MGTSKETIVLWGNFYFSSAQEIFLVAAGCVVVAIFVSALPKPRTCYLWYRFLLVPMDSPVIHRHTTHYAMSFHCVIHKKEKQEEKKCTKNSFHKLQNDTKNGFFKYIFRFNVHDLRGWKERKKKWNEHRLNTHCIHLKNVYNKIKCCFFALYLLYVRVFKYI